jgi:hypothetical protein
MNKVWYKSKTMWFNLAIVGGAAVDAAVGLLPTVEPLLSQEIYAITFFVVGIVNVALRAVTSNAVTLSNKS